LLFVPSSPGGNICRMTEDEPRAERGPEGSFELDKEMLEYARGGIVMLRAYLKPRADFFDYCAAQDLLRPADGVQSEPC
jgi:hypothetical protein